MTLERVLDRLHHYRITEAIIPGVGTAHWVPPHAASPDAPGYWLVNGERVRSPQLPPAPTPLNRRWYETGTR